MTLITNASSRMEENFKQQLTNLSTPSFFKGRLISYKEGTLSTTTILGSLWENIRALVGLQNRTSDAWLTKNVYVFVATTQEYIKTAEDLARVRVLAAKVGVTPSSQENKEKLDSLISEMSQRILTPQIVNKQLISIKTIETQIEEQPVTRQVSHEVVQFEDDFDISDEADEKEIESEDQSFTNNSGLINRKVVVYSAGAVALISLTYLASQYLNVSDYMSNVRDSLPNVRDSLPNVSDYMSNVRDYMSNVTVVNVSNFMPSFNVSDWLNIGDYKPSFGL